MITDRSMCREAKPRTPTVERKLDAMSQAVGARLTMNSPARGPRSAPCQLGKGFEYAAQLVPRNAFACVMNLDANGRPATSTAHEYALDSEEKGLM